MDNIAADESTLDAKIEKKKADLERQQKRLAQLQSVRYSTKFYTVVVTDGIGRALWTKTPTLVPKALGPPKDPLGTQNLGMDRVPTSESSNHNLEKFLIWNSLDQRTWTNMKN